MLLAWAPSFINLQWLLFGLALGLVAGGFLVAKLRRPTPDAPAPHQSIPPEPPVLPPPQMEPPTPTAPSPLEASLPAPLRDWLDNREPLFREWKKQKEDYPPDWTWRAWYVHWRDRWTCVRCGTAVALHLRDARLVGDRVALSTGFDTHHKKPISAGGRHELGNLELLCSPCHENEHPRLAEKRRVSEQNLDLWNQNRRG